MSHTLTRRPTQGARRAQQAVQAFERFRSDPSTLKAQPALQGLQERIHELGLSGELLALVIVAIVEAEEAAWFAGYTAGH